MVVLKPLASAIAAGDRIYAVIRGSAVNSDGDSSGSMGRPSRIGQEEVLRSALRDGGVTPAQLDYVEAHGTGTRAGDPVELDALAAVASEGRASTAPRLWVGSVKTNIGHTEAAAGVAGLIKASLMLQRGMIPRSLHFDEPNPDVKWAELPIAIPTTLISWPMREGTRFAGVSSYGIGGTNAHVVLESAPFVARAVAATASRVTAADSPVDRVPLLLSLSARSEAALHALASRYAELLSETGAPSVTDVCWSAATRRSALSHRAAFVARDRETLVSALRAFASGEPATADGIVHDRAPRRLAFVVPGQGAQWTGMARQFMAENAVFRAALDACDAAARRVVPWSIIEQLHLDASDESYIGDRIDVIQPTLVALAIAYAGWLRSVGFCLFWGSLRARSVPPRRAMAPNLRRLRRETTRGRRRRRASRLRRRARPAAGEAMVAPPARRRARPARRALPRRAAALPARRPPATAGRRAAPRARAAERAAATRRRRRAHRATRAGPIPARRTAVTTGITARSRT